MTSLSSTFFAPKACNFDVDTGDDDCMQPKQREALESSMAIMGHLRMDSQAKFPKMVEDNKQLTTRIDGDIHMAQEEVCIRRGGTDGHQPGGSAGSRLPPPLSRSTA